MKNTIKTLILATMTFTSAQAVEVDEIINGYIENTGGSEAWNNLQGMKLSGELNQGGMKFPFEILSLKDGRQYMKFTFQGKELKQGVFDGETMWSTNFMTMKAEKADAESTENRKLEMNDFPSPFLNWKENGYTVELMGTESKEGSDTYKVKLVKEPLTVDGESVEDISYYYFDTEAFVPVAVETEIRQGPMKGKVGENKMSDYQEVEGFYVPFSMTQGLKDGPAVTMTVSKVELNPQVSQTDFDMPVETETAIEKTETAEASAENK